MTAVLTQPRPIRLKGRSYLALTLTPELPFEDWLVRLDDLAGRSAGFFLRRPVVLDVEGLEIDRAQLRDLVGKLGTRHVRIMVVLCSAGGFGVGHIYQTIRAVILAASRAGGADVLVVAGRNQKLRARIQAIPAAEGVRLTVFGFVNNMHDLMAASDVMITKPGGLTASEGMARSLPMIVLDPIPGQEEANASYLQESGVAWRAHDLGSLDYKLGRLVSSTEDRSAMRRACERTGRPRAAFEVAKVLAGS